jgi:hypothetical protein
MADDDVPFNQWTEVSAGAQSCETRFETMVYPGLRLRACGTPADRLHCTLVTPDFLGRYLAPH